MGPVVCVVSDMWGVSGMLGSVVCGGKWDEFSKIDSNNQNGKLGSKRWFITEM